MKIFSRGLAALAITAALTGSALAQATDAVLKLLKPLLAERMVNSIVNPVTGDDQVGLRLLQHAPQPFVERGPGKRPARMARLRETRDCFAGKAEVEKPGAGLRESSAKIGLDELDVFTAVSDAVAQKDDATGLKKWRRFRREVPRGRNRNQSDLLHVHHRAGLFAQRSHGQ